MDILELRLTYNLEIDYVIHRRRSLVVDPTPVCTSVVVTHFGKQEGGVVVAVIGVNTRGSVYVVGVQ